MKQNNWNDKVYKKLVTLIKNNGINTTSYNPKTPPYAVFDFDNTTIINDIEEALLLYQLNHLSFGFTPNQIGILLKTGIPDVTVYFKKQFNNTKGEQLNTSILIEDITTAYKYLYTNYKGFNVGGKKSLNEIKNTPEFKAFVSKTIFLYQAITDTFDTFISYPWLKYFFTGLTKNQVLQLTRQSTDYWVNYKNLEQEKLTTPSCFSGKAGVISVSYNTGIRFPVEMKDLYTELTKNGIKVYICSASFKTIVEAIVCNSKYGFDLSEDQVYAMQLEKDNNDRYINKLDPNYFQTQKEGKTKTINTFIKPKHNNQDPILIAGDSIGDYSMLTSYKNLQLGLIINRNKKELLKLAENDNRYIVQSRNESSGSFIK